jgi:hypothetical protein
MRPKQILQFAPFIILMGFLVIFSGIGRSSIPGTTDDLPSVVNRTRLFEVVRVDRDRQQLHLKLKNSYHKTITAYEISIGQDFTITEEFVFAEVSEPGIKPQAVFSRSYPLPSTIQNQPSFNLTIKAIVLDDGSGDGDEWALKDIKAKRLGEEIQLRRAVEMLGRFFERSQSDIGQLKADVASALNSTDTDTVSRLLQARASDGINDKTLPERIKRGLDKGRESVLRKMANIENQNGDIDKLMQVKETYERILTRL